MKIIFDNEEQKDKVLHKILIESCPHRADLTSSDCMSVSCKECWEAAVEMEVEGENSI